VTGGATPYSDLDLVVMTDTPLSLAVSASLAEDLVESDLPFKVDVLDWARASERFRRIIGRDRVALYHGVAGCDA
jgi:type I restriction enzyme S subunit